MTHPIEYATTADGVRIAFSVVGAGRPVVYMPPLPVRHLELEWRLPEDRRWLDRLGRSRRLVRFDPRGLGLSERPIRSFGLEPLVLDLEAVVDAAGASGVAIFACLNTAPIAVAYAVRRPERVSRLILWCPVARMADAIPPQIGMLLDLAEKDWGLFTETAAHVMVGWSKGEAGHRYADYLRACVTPEVLRALIDGLAATDVTSDLERVRVPTLVLHRRGVGSVPVALATGIAGRTPGARLAILDGEFMRPGVGDVESVARAVDAFLGDALSPESPNGAEPAETAGARVFRRDGDYWTLAFEGRVSRVRDVKGLHHIARLLGSPGVELPALDLVTEPSGMAAALGDAGPLLDEQARRAYRRRMAELRSEIDDAERANDPARVARARAELEFVTREVSAAVGLRGRDRKASSTVERARLTVTKRIRDAMDRIRASHPALARHLGATIRTGRLCVYRPDAADAVRWTL